MDNVFQDGVFDTLGDNADAEIRITDDFNPCVAEMASVIDDDVLHAEPALHGDFDDLQSLPDDCAPSPVLAESVELYDGEDMNAEARHEDDFDRRV